MEAAGHDGQQAAADDKPAARTAAGIAAVDHAVAVLKVLQASRGPSGVSELARRVGLHKSTVSRLLATLERHQFVQRDPYSGRVSLGLGIVALASPMLGSLECGRVAKPVMRALARSTGETVGLALWNGHEAVMIDQEIGTRAVVHFTWAGKTVAAHATATGKVFLAYLSESQTKPLIGRGLKRHTKFTKTDPAVLAEDLARCRARGYAVNDQEDDLESGGVAAPIFDFRATLVAVISLAVPKHRFGEVAQTTLAGSIVRGAHEISLQLGWDGPPAPAPPSTIPGSKKRRAAASAAPVSNLRGRGHTPARKAPQ